MPDPVIPPAPGAVPPAGAPPVPPVSPAAPTPAPSHWLEALPEDVRSAPVFSSIKATDTKEALGIVAKQLVNAQAMIGKDKVLKPQADWTPEQWSAWSSEALGVPKDPAEYDLQIDAQKYADITDKEGLLELQKDFHQAGLSPKQASVVATRFLDRIQQEYKEQQATIAAQQKANDEALKQAWGADYEKNSQLADFAVRALRNEALAQRVKEDPNFVKDPAVAQLLKQVGELVSDDKALGSFKSGAPVNTAGLHPVQLQARINEIAQDPVFMKVVQAGGMETLRMRAVAEGRPEEAAAIAQRYSQLIKERTELYAQLHTLEQPK